ncbi:MAG: ABC transporter permease [Flavonifractor plautii]
MRKLNGRVLAGLAILSVVLLVALLAPVLALTILRAGRALPASFRGAPLGTNDIGQDILSELIYGTRISLLIGVVSALAVTVVGTALGILSGYLGGWTDRIIMQVTNVAMALPSLPLTIILVAFLDASVWNIILAICITAWTSTARIIRSRVQQLKALPFIQIERTMGASGPYIMIRHILPNWEKSYSSVPSCRWAAPCTRPASVFWAWCDRTEELGRHPALCLFPQWNHQRLLLVVCAAHPVHLGLCAWVYAAELLR